MKRNCTEMWKNQQMFRSRSDHSLKQKLKQKMILFWVENYSPSSNIIYIYVFDIIDIGDVKK